MEDDKFKNFNWNEEILENQIALMKYIINGDELSGSKLCDRIDRTEDILAQIPIWHKEEEEFRAHLEGA